MIIEVLVVDVVILVHYQLQVQDMDMDMATQYACNDCGKSFILWIWIDMMM